MLEWNIFSHERQIALIERVLSSHRQPHAYLFAGPQGVGKKRLALQFAQALSVVSEDDKAQLNQKLSAYPFGLGSHILLYQDCSEPLFIERKALLAYAKRQGVTIDGLTAVNAGKKLVDAEYLTEFVPSNGNAPVDRYQLNTEKLISKTDRSVRLDSFYEKLNKIKAADRSMWITAMACVEALGMGAYYGTLKINDLRRFLHQNLGYKQEGGRPIVIIMDEVQKLTREAENHLLKTLEEPPGKAFIILVTDTEHDLLPTIRSRCQILRFGVLSDEKLKGKLARMTDWDETRLELALSVGQGSLGRTMRLNLETLKTKRDNIIAAYLRVKSGQPGAPLYFSGALLPDAKLERVERREVIRNHLLILLSWMKETLCNGKVAKDELAKRGIDKVLIERGGSVSLSTLLEDVIQLKRLFGVLKTNADERLALEAVACRMGN